MAAPATDLVHALKYEGWPELAGFMGRRMASAVWAPGPAPAPGTLPWRTFVAEALVVPVPTTDERIRARGYNQAALLADVVAGRVHRPVAHQALRRREGGASQTTLSPERRRENVREAFEPGPAVGRVRGSSVLLIDDVLTTGATALAAAATLQACGAGEVRLLSFGRALPGRDVGGHAAA